MLAYHPSAFISPPRLLPFLNHSLAFLGSHRSEPGEFALVRTESAISFHGSLPIKYKFSAEPDRCEPWKASDYYPTNQYSRYLPAIGYADLAGILEFCC